MRTGRHARTHARTRQEVRGLPSNQQTNFDERAAFACRELPVLAALAPPEALGLLALAVAGSAVLCADVLSLQLFGGSYLSSGSALMR